MGTFIKSINSTPVININEANIFSDYSGEFDNINKEINNLFPDTYEDNYGEIQPRIFIEEEFVGKEVITSGRVELDRNGEEYSTVTVISVNEENGKSSWFESFIKKLGGFFS